MWTAILQFVLFCIVAALGAYIGTYLKVRGESWAKEKDIDRVVNEVRSVTETTKRIEATISHEFWDRQKLWEMKREVLFEASKAVARIEERLMRWQAVLGVAKDRADSAEWREWWHDALVEWREALANFENTQGLVIVVCSFETTAEFLKFGPLLGEISKGLAKKDLDIYDDRQEELNKASFRLRFAIRKELGVPTLQSTESSAAPNRSGKQPSEAN